jgi:nucleoid-associated protein YgaU
MVEETVESRQTAEKLAASDDIPIPDTAEAIAPEVTATATPTPTVAYTVEAGDTLWGIAGQHWPTVCQDNGIPNCDLIYPGQVIQIYLDVAPPRTQERHNE